MTYNTNSWARQFQSPLYSKQERWQWKEQGETNPGVFIATEAVRDGGNHNVFGVSALDGNLALQFPASCLTSLGLGSFKVL